MGTGDDITLPLINERTLEHLDAEVSDPEGYWKVFVRNYLELLPTRTDRIRLALTTADLDSSLDSVLSLKTSSQTIGAERLASLAADLEIDIRTRTRENNPLAVLPKLAAKYDRPIRRCAVQTEHVLQVLLEK